ncbi:GntR family transcriptional regulator [Roseibium sp. MMSF_3544]|uniref:GntR family transcriptional regulator n=1 Tax=unclassified Roseibium TaxID=2629323 RepID=UPI00273EB2E4|nr:GntR family transcriptional regulator [Roseibium sp. MMSF_3544]
MVEPLVLSRTSLADQIRDHLLSRIVQGELKPGERLVELKIATEMSTSQAPVREALRQLDALGIIETLRNKGARVRVIPDKELRELYDVRAQIEGYAAEIIAEQGAPLKTKLEEQVRKMRAAARANDSLSFSEHNTNFHRLILEATGNSTLIELWERLHVKVSTMVNVVRQNTDLAAVANSHQPIIDAIAARDPVQARKVAVEHVLANKPE